MRMVLWVAAVLAVCATAWAVPAEFKKDLKEPRDMITKAKSNVYYKKVYDGMSEQLDKAEQMLKDLAKKAGVDETDADIARLMKSIAQTRKELAKRLAKEGKVPGKVTPKDAPPKKEPKTPGPVTPKEEPKKEAAAPKAAPKKPMGTPDLTEADKLIKECKDAVYFNKDYSDARKAKLAAAEKAVKDAGAAVGADETQSDVKKRLGQIAKIVERLEKKAAEAGAAKAAMAAEMKVPDATYKAIGAEVYGAYDVLNRFLNNQGRSDDDMQALYEMAPSVAGVAKRAKELVEKVKTDIPDTKKYEGYNDDAKTKQFSLKYNFLKGVSIEKSEEKLESMKNDLVTYLEGDAETMKLMKEPGPACVGMARMNKRLATLEAIDGKDSERVKKVKEKTMPAAMATYKELLKQVAKMRMPKETYAGGDGDKLKPEMKKLYEAAYAGEKVLRVVITSEGWTEAAKAKFNNDGHIEAGVYRYLNAALAVEKASGCRVYTIGFRKTWVGPGADDFGPMEYHSVGSSFPIAKENVDK